MTNPIKLEFAPGCFDDFEGSQEELNELISEIQKSFENGDFTSNMQPVNMDELDEETFNKINEVLNSIEESDDGNKRRNLQ
jgi:hypothetical protein